ncbi:hypothetical protein A2866_05645 [Candidatus Roizmanbacteria bacterium RIFCSPHIGHO2_01_FULL_39_8]|uniref:Uncharacterized protein n=3 Tax=Candidatus Roizmaniibacteriota TaxID=1752723 RepID=A0A1F7GM27_9BACT|nr:MAG: hypothetical protein A2866_05645 [Candidatus Roizmanbacteria bacterium RIFCSPHIGHO2_01_FULL_39_8]OGK27084.1 MAG: hypothetical protein A3C28_02965 [Candidatus Roizmanbacteria bacterium RIFCSPHIGHO2_02_FULL_39_9]OGK35201.1 MAG: hypothetical protein A3F60_03755 [Candidatus Roizmanbacteria bacterium RIFCSPHIGHO2_12_FULL_39_8]
MTSVGETKPKIGFLNQLGNLFDSNAYVVLQAHKKLLETDGDQSQELKKDWNRAKDTFGPFIGLAQLLLATRLIKP